MQQRQNSSGRQQELFNQKYREKKRLTGDQSLVIKDGAIYIAKRINVSRFSNDEIKNLDKQIEQIRKLKHPHLLAYKETYKEKQEWIQIIEYAGCDSLIIQKEQTLKASLSRKPDLQLATQYLLQLMLAIDYLGDQNLMITPQLDIDSIILNDLGSVKLGFMLDKKKCDWNEEVKKVGKLFQSICQQNSETVELNEIQKALLQPGISPKAILNHPYLLKAMQDFYKKSLEQPEKRPNQQKKDKAIKDIYCRPKSGIDKIQVKTPIIQRKSDQQPRQRTNSHQNLPKDNIQRIQPQNKKSLEKPDQKQQVKKITIEPKPIAPDNKVAKTHQKTPSSKIPTVAQKSPLKMRQPEQPLMKPPSLHQLNQQKLIQPEKQLNQYSVPQGSVQQPIPMLQPKYIYGKSEAEKEDPNESILFELSQTIPGQLVKIMDQQEFMNLVRSEDKNSKLNDEQKRIMKTEEYEDSTEINIEETISDDETEQIYQNGTELLQEDFYQTKRKQELQDILQLYKSQLLQSAAQKNYGLNMSEIPELSAENLSATFNRLESI